MERAGASGALVRILEALTELCFVLAVFLALHELFWGVLVRRFALGLFEAFSAWPAALRLAVGLPLVALPVGAGAWILFGDPEEGGLARLLALRSSPRLAPWLTVTRAGFALLGAFALLKLVWLADDGTGWWSLALELLKSF